MAKRNQGDPDGADNETEASEALAAALKELESARQEIAALNAENKKLLRQINQHGLDDDEFAEVKAKVDVGLPVATAIECVKRDRALKAEAAALEKTAKA